MKCDICESEVQLVIAGHPVKADSKVMASVICPNCMSAISELMMVRAMLNKPVRMRDAIEMVKKIIKGE